MRDHRPDCLCVACSPLRRNRGGRRKLNARRDTQIRVHWETGESMSELAERFDLSRQRIEQIVKYQGWSQAQAKRRRLTL